MTKRCSSCGESKSLDAFAKNVSTRDGVQSHCKECFRNRHAGRGPLQNRMSHVKREYGLSWDRYIAMLEAQHGQCLICEKAIEAFTPEKMRVAHVDHDHATGEVRALLCHFCNSGMGYFKDDVRLLDIASWYLDTASRWGEPTRMLEVMVDEHF